MSWWGGSEEKKEEGTPPKQFKRMTQATEEGGFGFAEEAQLQNQRNVIWDFCKQMTLNVYNGNWNLIAVTMPIYVCQPRSYLQQLADGWCYTPLFLNKAADTTDPIERLKFVTCFALAGFHNTCCLKKPFNPILGETYEAHFEDGSRVFCEQSSHHPPVTNWQIFGVKDKFKMFGFGEWSASFRGNSVRGSQKGPHFVEFPDGGKIEYHLPEVVVKGILWGSRVIDYEGLFVWKDEKNKLAVKITLADPQFGVGLLSSWFGSKAQVPSDYFRGELYEYGNDIDDKVKVISKIEGSWLGAIEFDGKTYWDQATMAKSKLLPSDNPLPSDARFRIDAVALGAGDEEQAAKNKHELEQKQRRDRKLRKDAETARNGGVPVAEEGH